MARGYGRTLVAGAVSAGFVIAGLAPAGGAPAQASSAEASSRQAAFSPGQAKATAIVSRVAPGIGSLELAIASGVAISELKNNLTQAQAQSVDLGLIGMVLTAGSGCGSGASLRPDQLPQPTRVDNRGGPVTEESAEAPIGDLGAVGHELAEAVDGSSRAVATTALGLVPGLKIDGGQARTSTRVLEGGTREARAEVSLDLDLGGALVLSGMRWEAVHRTGAEPSATASFDVGTAELLGVPLPLESLTEAEKLVNTALAPLGVTITFPRVERFTEPNDLVRITPLRIQMRDGELGSTLISPLFTATREQRIQLFETIAGSVCEAASLPLVADIGLSIVGGTGFLIVDLGGAEAISGDLVLGNPFGPPIAPASPTPPSPAVSGPAAAPPIATTGPVAPPAPAPAPEPRAPEPAPELGPLEKVCQTIHPFASPGCSEGAMAPLGLAGLAATIGVGALDWRHQRKRLAATEAGSVPA